MPTYRYRRPDGTTFEVLQKFSDASLTEDPQTGVPVERVITGGAGLKFNGSGFYQTDYTNIGKAPKSETKVAPAKASGDAPKKAAPKPSSDD